MADNVNDLPALPIGATANNVPGHIDLLKDAINGGSIIRRLTGAQIAALTGVETTAGVKVYNTTTGKTQTSTGSGWVDDDEAALAATARVRSGVITSAAAGYADVTFSPAFASAPAVVAVPALPAGASSPNSVPYLKQDEVTASGARIRGLTLATGCYWIAVGA